MSADAEVEEGVEEAAIPFEVAACFELCGVVDGGEEVDAEEPAIFPYAEDGGCCGVVGNVEGGVGEGACVVEVFSLPFCVDFCAEGEVFLCVEAAESGS